MSALAAFSTLLAWFLLGAVFVVGLAPSRKRYETSQAFITAAVWPLWLVLLFWTWLREGRELRRKQRRTAKERLDGIAAEVEAGSYDVRHALELAADDRKPWRTIKIRPRHDH